MKAAGLLLLMLLGPCYGRLLIFYASYLAYLATVSSFRSSKPLDCTFGYIEVCTCACCSGMEPSFDG